LLDYYRAIFVGNKKNETFNNVVDAVENDVVEVEETKAETKEGVNFSKGAKITIFGDNLIHENVLNYANLLVGGCGSRRDYDLGFDFKPIYQKVEGLIRQADFALLNQASLVGANDSSASLSGYPLFNSPSQLGIDMIELGFDGVNIANNHLLDMSENGLKNSIRFWKTKEIHLIGGDETSEDFESTENKIVTVGGVRIAILSYTASTNGITYTGQYSLPLFTENGENIREEMLRRQIGNAANNSDFVMVLMNWGNNAGYEVSSQQEKTAKILANAGADIIIGTGPKVIQKMEWIQSDADDHEAFCAYSLGNSMGTMEYMDNLFGGVLTFEIASENEDFVLTNILFTPTVIHYDKDFSNIALIPLSEYSEELFMKHGSNIHFGFGTYSWFRETVNHYIPSEYLPAELRK